jgi:hypothetical protein
MTASKKKERKKAIKRRQKHQQDYGIISLETVRLF